MEDKEINPVQVFNVWLAMEISMLKTKIAFSKISKEDWDKLRNINKSTQSSPNAKENK